MSASLVNFFVGVLRLIVANCSGSRTDDISDSKNPGAMVFTEIDLSPSSLAKDLEKESNAPWLQNIQPIGISSRATNR